MTQEKRILLDKINMLLDKRRTELINKLPSIHEIDDGVVIRYFDDWDSCNDNGIKYRIISNENNPKEQVIFFFIPEGATFDLKQKYYFSYITCLNGYLDLTIGEYDRYLDAGTRIYVDSDEVYGRALKNSYVVTTSDMTKWSNSVKDYVISKATS